jgi:hypothetical protein
MLNNSVALDSVHRHGAAIVYLSEGTKSFVMGWGNHMNLMACSYQP